VADAVKKNSERVATAVKEVEKSADPTTVLAADRTIFAAERHRPRGRLRIGPVQRLLVRWRRMASAVSRRATTRAGSAPHTSGPAYGGVALAALVGVWVARTPGAH
jgi:hypothetical protein